MSTQDYIDVSHAPHGHNVSAQHRVVEKDAPALKTSQEHQHGHLHHDKHAEQGCNDEVVYSEGTTFEESTTPPQDAQDHDLARRRRAEPAKKAVDIDDTEKGSISPDRFDEEDPRTHTLSSYYSRHRIFAHLFIWLFFTGFVVRFPYYQNQS